MYVHLLSLLLALTYPFYQDWINDTVDVKGKGVDRGPARGRAAEAADQVKRNEELRAMFVVVPPGDEAKSIRCPICKETLKSEFLEDDEEWVWKNAVKKDDTVCSLILPLL